MHQCENCGGLLLTVESKCYDNFWIYTDKSNSELLAYVPENSGIGYDGTMLSLSFCSNCGKVHGSFPIKVAVVNESLSEPPKVSVGEVIGKIYANSLLGNMRACIDDMKWVSIRISSVDFTAMTESYNTYIDLKKTGQNYREYFDIMEELKQRYLNQYC